MTPDSVAAKTTNTVFSWVATILFSAFTAYDTQRLKEDARSSKAPDYINSSLGLYLDFLNLFESIGSLEE
jgi:FtsH-binding integral membrane protein